MIPHMPHYTIAPDLEALRQQGVCCVSNAIELFDERLRNEGFSDGSIRCLTPGLGAVIGHAVTVRIRCSSPPVDGVSYLDRTDWWEFIRSIPAPRIVVIQDLDPQPGLGALVGEVHASILAALLCKAVVTNGSVRDLPALREARFHAFAPSLAVSHAYSHIVDFGTSVQIGGLRIRSGDILLGDMHGVLSVPPTLLHTLPEVARELRERENRIIDLCRSNDFSLERLRDLVAKTS